MELIQSIQKFTSYLKAIGTGLKERVQIAFNQNFSHVKTALTTLFTCVTRGVTLATAVTCVIPRIINVVTIALLFIGASSIVVHVSEANAQSNPTVSISTLYTEFAVSDFSEWGLLLTPAQNVPITVGVTEGGTATRSGTAISEVTIPAGTRFVNSRQTFSTVGTYTVALNTSSSYDFGSSSSISVTAVDGTNLPVVSLDAAPTVSRTDESFSLTVRVNPAPTTFLNTRFTVLDYGANKGFFPGVVATRWSTIRTSGSDNIVVEISRDGMVDGDGIIRVEMLPHPGYKLSSTAALRDVAIPSHTQTGTPEISLTGVPDSVTRGHDFRFTIEAAGTIESAGLQITVQFGEGSTTIITGISPGTYVDGGNSTVTVPQSGSVEVTVSTTKPSSNANQNLTIILAGAGSTYTISNSDGSASATILSKDNSSPTASNPRISLETFSSEPVTSVINDSIKFKILASHRPTSTVTVNIRARSTGDNFINGDFSMKTQRLNSSGLITDFDVGIAPISSSSTLTGTIVAELMDGTGYTLADNPSHKTTANLISTPPIVSVTGEPDTVTQGHPFSFTVAVTTQLFSSISVRIQLNDENSGIMTGANPTNVYVANNAEGRVTIPISGSIEVTVNTTNPAGSNGNVNGNITLNNPQGSEDDYVVDGGGTTRVYPVVLKDNSLTSTTNPRVSIEAASTALVRADQRESANFIITATPQPTGTIRVSYMVSETGNFVDDGADSIVLSTSETTTMLEIPTTNPSTGMVDANSTITAMLLDGTNYTLSDPSGHVATRIITNNEGSLLTIQPASLIEGDANETGKMIFTVMALPTSPTPLSATWTTSVESDDSATADTDFNSSTGTVTIAANATSGTFEVDIKGDDTIEFHETFTVTLSAGSTGTQITAESGVTKGTITNDDGTGLSIESASVVEGADGQTTNMEFTVSVIPPSSNVIMYTWATSDDTGNTAAESGNEGDYTTSGNTETIIANAPTSTFSVPILDDEKVEPDETFIVTLSNPIGADKLLINSVTGTILDNDAVPVITIATDSGFVEEASPSTTPRVMAKFILSATGLRLTRTLMINATPTEENTSFLPLEVANIARNFPVEFTDPDGDGIYSGLLSVDIHSDDDTEDNGEITLTLNPVNPDTATYKLGSAVSGTIFAVDDDYTRQVPRVSIELESETSISEGGTIDISIITGDPAPSLGSPIEVYINVVQEGGDYIAFRVPRWKRLTSNSDSIKIYTHNDTVPDGPGMIIISIFESGDRYIVNPIKAEVEVGVFDSDSANSSQESRVSVAGNAISAILGILDASPQSSRSQSVTPAILPMISVSAVSTIVDEGTPVQFSIAGNENLTDDVLVEYTLTPEGDFFDNLSDDVQSINLTEAQKIAQVEIATINDIYSEQDGALTLTLLDRDTYDLADQSNARVVVSDLADRQQRVEDIILAAQDVQIEMTGAIAARTLGLTTERISEAFASSGVSSSFNYNGNESLTSLLTAGGEALNRSSMTLREVLGSSSFAISLFPEAEGPSMATIWGLGDYRDVKSTEGSSRSWDADVFTGHLGLDAMVGQGMLVGISAAVTESDTDHTGATEGALTFKSRTTALNPYLGWTSSDQDVELRAVAGYGVGEIDIDQTSYELQTVSNIYHTLGISGNQRIYASESIIEGGSSELSITGQTWYARQNLFGVEGFINSMQTDASHYRIGIEGSHTQKLASGSTLKPTFSIGMRGDGKNDQSIFGMEVGGGLNYTSTFGLSLTGNSSMFLIEQGEIQKWSIIGTVNYDRGNDKLGTIMEVSPSYGQMQGGNSRSLWSSDILESVSETGQYMDGVHVDTELGYGLSILGDTSRLTPFGGIDYSDDADNKYHVGTRLQLGSDLKFELTGTQETDAQGKLNQQFKLDGAFNW